MKWRSSIIYLVVFLLIGGYFYYFEVIRKDQKIAAEQESKRVFHFKVDDISSIEITSKDKNTVLLKKEKEWKVVSPIQVDADRASLDGVIASLSNLDIEREVDPAPTDLKPYGLQDPALKIRFQVGGKWEEVLLGNKNPAGDDYYFKTGDKPAVGLVAAGNWSVLDKGVDDLRRRELFSFQQDDVQGIHVAWQDGKTMDVEKQQDGSWKAPDNPRMVIKKSKIDNIIEQIKWLRALKFIDNDPTKLDGSGLDPALVTIDLKLQNNQTVNVRIGRKDKNDKQLTALSSELPAIVQVHPGFIDAIPKDLNTLEDRSLFSMKPENVKQIDWRIGDTERQIEKNKDGEWGLKGDKGAFKPLKESWHVRTLLWDIRDTEYQSKVDPMPAPPDHPRCTLSFKDGTKELVNMSWDSAAGPEAQVTVWLKEGDSSKAVQVDKKKISKVEDDLNMLLQPEDLKGAP
jgi:hypothetical protein